MDSVMDSAMNWHARIDRLINLLKWPAAALAVAGTPLLAWALLKLSLRIVLAPSWSLLFFVLGVAAFILLWRRWLGRSRFGGFLITLEHESTHALFALLTGHRIIGFRASLGRGGEVHFAGRGNWLIAAAPYFFPTAALLLFLVAYLLPFPGLPWQSFLLGVALGYHIVSTYRETHRDQTDLQLLGMTFCWLFLPAANLAVVGLLVSFAHTSSQGLSVWLGDITQPLAAFLQWLPRGSAQFFP
ncbi:MAG: M50 family metallopeptidase [Planctomycetales bacterium]|nr:M50 family metallopeptidase [Planctomycetales bacterium]